MFPFDDCLMGYVQHYSYFSLCFFHGQYVPPKGTHRAFEDLSEPHSKCADRPNSWEMGDSCSIANIQQGAQPVLPSAVAELGVVRPLHTLRLNIEKSTKIPIALAIMGAALAQAQAGLIYDHEFAYFSLFAGGQNVGSYLYDSSFVDPFDHALIESNGSLQQTLTFNAFQFNGSALGLSSTPQDQELAIRFTSAGLINFHVDTPTQFTLDVNFSISGTRITTLDLYAPNHPRLLNRIQ
ncbi:MAG: hypothetical protein K8R23_00060 [Chthoniobacter sp.]|nr:hypothetical protein [Chthoniobacter sp.]